MLVKVLASILLVVSFIGALATFGYLSTKKELESLQSKYTQLEQGFKECSESKSKLEESKKQDESIVWFNAEKLRELDSQKDEYVHQIDLIPSKRCINSSNDFPTKSNSNESNQTIESDVADIDDKLPSDVIRLSDKAFNRN